MPMRGRVRTAGVVLLLLLRYPQSQTITEGGIFGSWMPRDCARKVIASLLFVAEKTVLLSGLLSVFLLLHRRSAVAASAGNALRM